MDEEAGHVAFWVSNIAHDQQCTGRASVLLVTRDCCFLISIDKALQEHKVYRAYRKTGRQGKDSREKVLESKSAAINDGNERDETEAEETDDLRKAQESLRKQRTAIGPVKAVKSSERLKNEETRRTAALALPSRSGSALTIVLSWDTCASLGCFHAP